jgi:ankyrin repeat protein
MKFFETDEFDGEAVLDAAEDIVEHITGRVDSDDVFERYMERTEILEEKGDYAAAAEELGIAIDVYKEGPFGLNRKPPLIHRRGLFCLKAADYDRAYRYFSAALALTPDNRNYAADKNRAAALRLGLAETEVVDDPLEFFAKKVEAIRAEKNKTIREQVDEKDYINALILAAQSEDYEFLERYFAEGLPLTGLMSPVLKEWSPSLIYYLTLRKVYAGMSDPERMIRYLVDHGADPNLPAGDGSTALWNECNRDGDISKLELLLETGADPNQISIDDGMKWAPLVYALFPETYEHPPYSENAPLIVQCIAGNKGIDHFAIRRATFLLAHGADPNGGGDTGWKPLLQVAAWGRSDEAVDLAKRLIEKGADVNAVIGGDTLTPLDFALKNAELCGDIKSPLALVKLLREHGAVESGEPPRQYRRNNGKHL